MEPGAKAGRHALGVARSKPVRCRMRWSFPRIRDIALQNLAQSFARPPSGPSPTAAVFFFVFAMLD